MGLLCCLDAVIFCLTLLPVKIILSCMTFFKKIFSEVTITPQHYYALFQGGVILVCTFALDFLDLSEAYEVVGQSLGFTKLYVLFNLFSVLDTLLEQLGKRVMWALTWSILNEKHRRITFAVTCLYVFVHCIILTVQISTLHYALDFGTQIFTLLLAIKFAELRSGSLKSYKKGDNKIIKKICMSDVVERFKWAIFLVVIFCDKLTSHHDSLFESIQTPWFWTLLQNSAIVWFTEMATDWMKHGSLIMVNSTWLNQDTYRDLRQKLAVKFDPTVSHGGTLSASISKSFDFVTLPYTCLVVRMAYAALFSSVEDVTTLGMAFIHVLVIMFFLFLAKRLIREFFHIYSIYLLNKIEPKEAANENKDQKKEN